MSVKCLSVLTPIPRSIPQMFWSFLFQGFPFPGGSVVKNPPANAGDMGSILRREDPLEKEVTTHSSILVQEIPWTRSLMGYSP